MNQYENNTMFFDLICSIIPHEIKNKRLCLNRLLVLVDELDELL